jgi:hypothetical protein
VIVERAEANPTLLQPDRRTRWRYNRRDTPARLYRHGLMRDQMRSVGTRPEAARRTSMNQENDDRETPPRPRSESRQRTALVAVRLLPQERDMLARSARSRGVTLSEFIRSSAIRTAGAAAEPKPSDLPGRRAS